jgi:tetratricopeptide (TPR) repeat protein
MSPEYQEGENAISMGAYPQAFEIFLDVESLTSSPVYLRCCQMALANQLSPQEVDHLATHLDKEVQRRNGQAAYNYGLVMAHIGEFTKASDLLTKAMNWGVPQAKTALTKILLNK